MANDILSEMADQAGLETKKSKKPVAKPDFKQDEAGRYIATWETDGIRVVIEAPERNRLEFWVLMSVFEISGDEQPRALLHRKRWNLRSGSGTSEHVRTLSKQRDRDWDGRLNWISYLVDERYSSGEPMVWVHEVADPGSVLYLADPLLEAGEHNILVGSGGSTKSFLALAMCISYARGKSLVPGIGMSGKGKALYLDWEASKPAMRRRFAQFASGVNEVAYKRMTAPLADVADEIEQMVKGLDFGLVVIDSASMASGGEIMDEASVARFFLATRSLKTTVLTLAHLPKDSERDGPIGSVYWFNQARVVWRITKDQLEGDSTVRLDLVQQKSNNDMVHRPIGVELDFAAHPIRYKHADAGGADETKLPLASRIERHMTTEGTGKFTAAELAEALGKSLTQIINTLKKGEGKIFAHDSGKRDRLWWAVVHSVNKESSHVNNGYSHGGLPKGSTPTDVHSLGPEDAEGINKPPHHSRQPHKDDEEAPAW